MHIAEGVLSGPVLVAGAALAAAGTAVGLRKLNPDRMPQVAVLTAGFFVAALVRVPVGPVSTHMVLTGLMGLLLGWAAFPAILVGLLLQAILFQFGGLTTLGVNTMVMAGPAVLCHLLAGPGVRSPRPSLALLSAFLGAAMAVFLGSLLVALALVFTGQAFSGVATVVVVAHLPVMLLEGVITALALRFLKRVRPEILQIPN